MQIKKLWVLSLCLALIGMMCWQAIGLLDATASLFDLGSYLVDCYRYGSLTWLWHLGLTLGLVSSLVLFYWPKAPFAGAPFIRFLRGSRISYATALNRRTYNRRQSQVSLAGVALPVDIENLHFLIGGSTGAGKTQLIQGLVYSLLLRGDRMVVVDPNGELYAQFGNQNDFVLNAFDARSQGWSMFNEIRNTYDFQRLSFSIVPRGLSDDAEEWAGYARLLLSETARKLVLTGKPTIEQLFHYLLSLPAEDLHAFLKGTPAESLFVGPPKALASARFVLSNKLSAHLVMPTGNFSLRDWLETPSAGNLYITYREDMLAALKPMISSWIDILCTAVLSLSESKSQALWLILDELASLDKLGSLNPALTKGRKHGLRVVAGLQSIAQLDHLYGVYEAQTLRACFRSLVVLGGARTDPKTCEAFSLSLGEHEVERWSHTQSQNGLKDQSSQSSERRQERIVLASEIAGLAPLTGFLALAGPYSVARIKIVYQRFKQQQAPFIELCSVKKS